MAQVKYCPGFFFLYFRSRLRRFLHRFQQRPDPFPRYLCLVHRVKQLCRACRFTRQLQKAGEKRRKCRDIPRAPPRPEHIFLTKIQNEYYAGHGNHFIYRRQHRTPYIRLYRRFFIRGQLLLISRPTLPLTAEHPVSDRILRPVQRRCT